MLVINDGADGIYFHNSQEILIGKNWHIAGLLHEITHAVLNADEPRTCHDGVFADKFTQIVHEVFEKENIKLKKQLSIALDSMRDSRELFYQLSQIEIADAIGKQLHKIKEVDNEKHS